MKISLTTFSKIFVIAALGLSALSVHAVQLNTGVNTILPGTTVASEPQLAGTVLVDETIPFYFLSPSGGGITGNVQQRIVRSSVDQMLDFYWQVMNDANSAGAIGSFRIGNFVSPEYNANWRSDGVGDKAPDSALRFPTPLDSDVNFNFNLNSTNPLDGLLPGQSSKFFFFDTTATNYAKTAFFDLTNMTHNPPISGSFAAYSPVAAVPEPETYTMLLAGLGLMGFMARRRKQNFTA